MEKRRAERVSPNSFTDYKVDVTHKNQPYNGIIGNISDDGACIMFSSDATQPFPSVEIGDPVKGEIRNDKSGVHLTFQGEIRWNTQQSIHHVEFLLVGMQFKPSLTLPDKLYALSQAI